MNFDIICRLCLGTKNLNPLFSISPSANKCNYAETINKATGLKVEENDNLPQKICTDCSNCIKNWQLFCEKCQTNEKTLLEVLKEKANQEECIKVVKLEIKPEELDVKLECDSPNVEPAFINFNSDLIEQSSPSKTVKNGITDVKKLPKPTNDNVSSYQRTKKVETNYWEHIGIFTPLEGNKHKVLCKLCNKSLVKRSIETHMFKVHPSIDANMKQCELCDKYLFAEKMKRHCMLVHGMKDGDGNSCCCAYCKKFFNDKTSLIEHLTSCEKKLTRKKSWNNTTIVKCDDCGKSIQKCSLRTHKAKHSGLAPVCEHCGKIFGSKHRLLEHCRAKHGYEKLKCKYCDFTTPQNMALRNHERKHRNEKPYACSQCEAKFHASYLLAQHRNTHKTEKVVKCDLCPASFKASHSLHTHRVTCHGKSQHKCNVCSREFSCRQYAVKHLRKVHKLVGDVGTFVSTVGDVKCAE